MTQGDLDDSTVSVPIVAGLGLVATSVVFAGRTAAGVTVRISGYDVIALTAGTLAVGLGVWGLLAATRGPTDGVWAHCRGRRAWRWSFWLHRPALAPCSSGLAP
ncbi:hypothetical protein [Halorhabdus sp. CBA1104]|uniref:hypothetical protein n=1 Tax=Halorhabdus sp. CBA1104 TaxID=1380432 RepID=UPI0018A6D102|nr:hypothetical protein [Halorhabdus sp. CBA1104]